MEYYSKQEKIAQAYEKHHWEYCYNLMPDAPGLNMPFYRNGHKLSEHQAAQECYGSEQQWYKQFAARIEAESERLEQEQYQKYYDAVYQAILDTVAIRLERIFSVENRHTAKIGIIGETTVFLLS